MDVYTDRRSSDALTFTDAADGEAALERLVERVTERLGDLRADWWTAVIEEAGRPLREALVEAAARHRAAARRAGLLADAPDPEPPTIDLPAPPAADSETRPEDPQAPAPPDPAIAREALWRDVRTYREEVEARVLAPFQQTLETLNVGVRLVRRWRSMQDEAAALLDAMPRIVVRPESAAVYETGPGDHPARRMRKATVRWKRRLDAWRRHPAAPQRIDLRRLTAYHVRVRLASAQTEIVDDALRRLAWPLAAVEPAVDVWARAVLDAEAALDAAAHGLAEPYRDVTEDPQDHPPPVGLESVRAALDDAATLLDAALRRAVVALDWVDDPAVPEAAQRRLAALDAVFRDDARVGGTFMLPPASRSVTEEARAPARRQAELETAWSSWYRQTADHVRLQREILGLYADFDALHLDQMEHVVSAAVEPVTEVLRAAAARLRRDRAALALVLNDEHPPGELADRIAEARTEAERFLETDVLDALDRFGPVRVLRERAAAWPPQVADRIAALPVAVGLNPRLSEPGEEEDEPEIDPEAEPRTVRLQGIARQAIDAFRLDDLARAVRPVVDAVRAAREAIRPVVGGTLRSGLTLAEEELRAEAEGADSRRDAVREAAMNAYRHAADTLDGYARDIEQSVSAAARLAHDRYGEGWRAFHERVRVSDAMQARLMDLRAGLSGRWTAYRTAGAAQLARARTRIGMLLRQSGRRARTFVRWGRQAVAGEAARDALSYNLELVAGQNERLGRIPYVYRRLFSFQPLSDATLLVGRHADLEAVRRHVHQWRLGLTNALVLIMPAGSGHTSFLNVVREQVLEDFESCTLDLSRRLTEESGVAALLAETLGVELTAPHTLDALAEAIRRREEPGRSQACLIEGFEHLVLRTVDGLELVRRVLGFFSRTDAEVLWIVTATPPGWQLVEKIERVSAGLARTHRMAPMDRNDLEALVMRRHERGGVALHFLDPEAPSALQLRALRRARTESDRQAVLRDAYFNRLYAVSGQDLVLALFYWLHSLDPDPDLAVLNVAPVQPLDFSFLDTLDLSRTLSLKAFLEHLTLTLEEHDAIFRCSRAESVAVFESLANLYLIVPAQTVGHTETFVCPPIDADTRYRIRPLVMHPVVQYLRRQHVLY